MTAVGGRHQPQTVLHAYASVSGSDDHTRLRNLRTACGGEHHIGRRQENERVHVLFVEGAA